MTSEALIWALAAWSASLIFHLALATALLPWLAARRPAIDLVIFGVLCVFITTAVTLLAGLAGWLTPPGLGLIGLLGVSSLVAYRPGQRALVEGLQLLGAIGRAGRHAWQPIPTWLRWTTVIFAGASIVRFAYLTLLLPPFVWDSLTYHLTNVAHWVQAGRIELFETPMVRIYSAANYEVLAAWFSVFFHHDLLIEAAGLPAYALAMAAMYAIARRLGAGPPAAWVASLAYATTPALLVATTGTKNDPHMAAYFLSALALCLHLFAERSDERPAGLGPLFALATLLLLAAGTKVYLLQLLPAIFIVGSLSWLRSKRRQSLADWLRALRRAWNQLPITTRVALLLLLSAGLFVGGYWNVRNWLLTGNPLFPYGVSIEGQDVLASADRTAALNFGRLAENLRLLAERFGDRLEPIRPDLPYVTGWGWFVYTLGLPASAWALLVERRYRLIFLGFALSFLLMLMSTRPSPWNMRYAIWFPAVFALGFALFQERLRDGPAFARRAFATLLVVAFSLNVATTLNYNRASPDEFAYMANRSPWSRHAASLRLTVPSEYENALVYVPDRTLIGYHTHSNGFIYPLYRADFSSPLVYIPFSPETSCSQIAERMILAGTRYLFVAPEHSPDSDIAHLRGCGDAGTHLRERARGLYVLNDH